MSSADQALIRYVLEVTPGTTPTDDAGWKELPITGESITAGPNYTESEVMNPARTLQDLILTGKAATGNVDGELRAADWDDLIEAALKGTWTTEVCKIGTVKRSYSIEEEYLDLTNTFRIATGMEVSTLALSVAYGGVATVSFGFEGFDVATAVASAVGLGTSTAASANPSMEGSAGTVVNIDGAPVAGAVFRSFNLNLGNNMRPIEGMGTVGRDGIESGSAAVTGSLEMYYSDATKSYYDDLLSGASRGVDVTITRNAKSFKFDVPAAVFSAGDPNAGSRNSDVMLALDFTGKYDATDDTSLVVTRVP